MKKNLIIIILFYFAAGSLSAADVPWADGRSRAEDIRIKLVTFGVGEELSTWWGHNGVIVEDVRLQRSRIYNFGIFSISDKMLRNFAMGRLIFSGGDASVSGYLSIYRRQKRDIRISTINLTPKRRLEIARRLADAIRPENKYYRGAGMYKSVRCWKPTASPLPKVAPLCTAAPNSYIATSPHKSAKWPPPMKPRPLLPDPTPEF
jgi:hypothetical protein